MTLTNAAINKVTLMSFLPKAFGTLTESDNDVALLITSLVNAMYGRAE